MSIVDYFGIQRGTPQGRSQAERLAREQALWDAAVNRDVAVQEDPRVRQPTTVVSEGFTRTGAGGFDAPTETVFTNPAATDPRRPGAVPPSTPEQLDPGYGRGLPRTPQNITIGNILGLLGATGSGGGGGGGVGGVGFSPIAAPAPVQFTPSAVDRSLYALEETAAERQALIDARADLDARARAGAQSIANTWQAVENTNRAAAEKARSIAGQYGMDASNLWVNAASQAREASVLRAAAAMANAGRAPIDLDPMAGGGAFIAAMESLALPEGERAFVEGQMQAERADWAGDIAVAQSAAYQGELQRTSMIMAADMAREHNARVLERIGRERQQLADAERQTDLFNRQLQAQIDQGNIERQFTADQFNAQQRQAAAIANAQLRASQSQSQDPLARLRLLQEAGATSAMLQRPEILTELFPNIPLSEARSIMATLQEQRDAGLSFEP